MVAWVVVELLIKKDIHRPATSAAAALTATVTLFILFAYRVKVLFRNHDPFVDTASVASGEYFSGTMGRLPSTSKFFCCISVNVVNDEMVFVKSLYFQIIVCSKKFKSRICEVPVFDNG